MSEIVLCNQQMTTSNNKRKSIFVTIFDEPEEPIDEAERKSTRIFLLVNPCSDI